MTPPCVFYIIQKKQDEYNWTEVMVLQEELKTLPFDAVWEEYCSRCSVPAGIEWLETVQKYEKEILSKRG